MSDDFDDVTEKQILAEISRQLHQQNQLLAQLVDEPEKQPELYKCELCNETVAKENRENHLGQSHNPPSGVDIDKRFTEL